MLVFFQMFREKIAMNIYHTEIQSKLLNSKCRNETKCKIHFINEDKNKILHDAGN